MATSTRGARARAASVPKPSSSPPADPDGGAGDIHDLLTAAVAEAAGLLKADGAMIYLLDPDSGILRFAHDAGIESLRGRELIRGIRLPIGVGLFGRAVAERTVVVTGDYLRDPAFEHTPDPDEVVREIGVRSMVVAPMVAGDEVFGALGTFSGRVGAFDPAQIGLVRALADHAAAAMRNARLIEALDASRGELARRAQTEQVLREIGTRITVMRDADAILQDVVEQAGRLVRADGVILDLLDPVTGNLHWALDNGLSAQFSADEQAKLWISVGVGATGVAVAEDRVVVADDDLAGLFPPSPESTEFYERTGFHSMIAAPITGDRGPLGVLEVYSRQRAAFGDDDSRLVGTLAGQAAIAITNARLIDELARSREDLAHSAEAERTLREIAGRVSAMRDQGEILQSVIDASVRLLGATGAMIDLLGEAGMAEAWASHEAGVRAISNIGLLNEITLDADAGVSGRALRTLQVEWTGEYLTDDRFQHTPERDAFVRESNIHSVIAAPLVHRGTAVGAITVYGDRPDAFGGADAGLLAALADQAAVAIANARLIEELERSRADIAKRADSERTLREIAARVSAILDPAEVLQRIVDEATRLLASDGARIDLYDPEIDALRWAYAAGEAMALVPDWATAVGRKPGEAVTGTAFAEERPIRTDDYLADDRFQHDDRSRTFVAESGLRSVIAVPLAGEDRPLGTLSVSSRRLAAYDDADTEVMVAFATQASIAIRNARLIEALERSQATVARRADTERALREITARIAGLREPEVILRRVVEEARRLLDTDGAHLTRMSDDRTYLVPVVVAGSTDPDDRAWLLSMRLPLGGGMNGLAAKYGEAIWTLDYRTDPRIPHEPDDIATGERLGLRGMAVAPLRAPGGDVIGTLAVSASQPRPFNADEIDLLQGLADQAAIAITNSTLLARLTESENRYRYLVERAPDLVWSIDADARLMFVSDAVVRLTGRYPDEVLGRHFGALLHESSHEVADFDWTSGMAVGSQEVRGRINLVGRDGEAIPAEFIATARLDETGAFIGANGSVRDMREHDRLERELRESESRYRFLVENSPDIVFSIDAEGRFTFMSDTVERVAGWRPEQVLGQHFSMVVDVDSYQTAATAWTALASQPTVEQVAHINMISPDGRLIPVEVSSVGMVDTDGRFAGIHGATRDISERTSLERELRRQAGELAAGEERAHLARELHDSVTQALFSMTLVTRAVELQLDSDPPAARTQLGQLRDLQREALAEMRALIFELRPGNLEQDGLTRALRTHTAAIQGRIGLPVVLESSLAERLPLAIEEVLYRIAQEALHNVIKHAAARQVRLDIGRSARGVELRIADDGKGFDPATVPDGHLGLAGMRARAEKIGARFECRSEPGQGTTIEVSVPDAVIAIRDL